MCWFTVKPQDINRDRNAGQDASKSVVVSHSPVALGGLFAAPRLQLLVKPSQHE